MTAASTHAVLQAGEVQRLQGLLYFKRAAEKETQSIVTHPQEFNQELSVYIVDKEIEMNVYIHLRTIQ
jgi:hypothetical protein